MLYLAASKRSHCLVGFGYNPSDHQLTINHPFFRVFHFAGVNWYNILAYGQSESASRSTRMAHRLSPMAAAAAPEGIDQALLASSFHRTVTVPYGQRLGDPLSDFMNGIIRTHLNNGPAGKVIPDSVTWGGQSDAVFSALSGDFMRPVYDVVDSLLTGGKINVSVMSCCRASGFMAVERFKPCAVSASEPSLRSQHCCYTFRRSRCTPASWTSSAARPARSSG